MALDWFVGALPGEPMVLIPQTADLRVDDLALLRTPRDPRRSDIGQLGAPGAGKGGRQAGESAKPTIARRTDCRHDLPLRRDAFRTP
ncbi:hypothetical protein ABZ871_40610 [Streptomyces populi]